MAVKKYLFVHQGRPSVLIVDVSYWEAARAYVMHSGEPDLTCATVSVPIPDVVCPCGHVFSREGWRGITAPKTMGDEIEKLELRTCPHCWNGRALRVWLVSDTEKGE